MATWYDIFKLFSYAFTPDPLSKKTDTKELQGAGISSPDSVLDLRNLESLSAGGAYIRVQNELIDTTSSTNRTNRYKEYDRLVLSVPEIEMAMTVFADEACVAGSTLVQTIYDGPQTIEWLFKNKKDDRFPVYAYDSDKEDYTIAWAYAPRYVKTEKTIMLVLDNGTTEIVTPDHKILKRDGSWSHAGDLQFGDELMPFYKLKANHYLSKQKVNQFPRIFTFNKGWIHERQFLDEWRLGKSLPRYERVNKVAKMVTEGLRCKQIEKIMQYDWISMNLWLKKAGFTFKELRHLAKRENKRRVIGVIPHKEIPVYDISVEKYKNFCTSSLVMHNCQKDEDGKVFKITCKNKSVIENLEGLFFDRGFLNFDQRNTWDKFKRLCIKGDGFWELIIDPDDPQSGVLGLSDLPPETMFRIETIKGKVLEFQQSKEAPDYQSIVKAPIQSATKSELQQSTAIRFTPEQIVHTKIGDYRRTFYPYGISLIEPARGPAHQLRMMEDAMVIYRLCIRSYDKITTDNGWKYMKDIHCDDVVWAYSRERGKLEKTQVVWHGNVGKKPVFKVSSKHTNITGTDLHPVLVYDKTNDLLDYVKIKDLVVGKHQFFRVFDTIETPKKIDRFYGLTYARLSKEQKSKYKISKYNNKKTLIERSLVTSGIEVNKKNTNKCWSFLVCNDNRSLPIILSESLCNNFSLNKNRLIKHNHKERIPERISLPDYVNEEFSELFGFLLGDGCISYHKKSAKLLFATGEYPEINEKYKKILIKYFGYGHFSQDQRCEEGIGCFCVNSITACNIMKNLGLTGDCYTKRIPGWVFAERKEIRKAVIKGIADAEGNKREMGYDLWRTTIRLVNRNLVEDIKQLWESLGYHASEIKKVDEPERWIKGKLIPAGEGWEVYLSETEVPTKDDIIEIEPAGAEDVYDLTVNHEEHNFLANGVPVHNSRAPERRVFYIDVGQLPPYKAEAFMDRIKDQFRKKKVPRQQFASGGASAVEEKWHAPAQDEDYWVPMRPNSTTRIDTLPGACLALNTKIPLLDGRILELAEIIKEYESGKVNWIYSCNPETGSPAPGKITWAGITRRNTDVVKITLDDGEEIICTPDHKFPIIGKGKIQAKDLQIGESLIAFNTRLENIFWNRKGKYLQIYNNKSKKWEFVHKMVANFVLNTKYEQTMTFNESKHKEEIKNVIHSCNPHIKRKGVNLKCLNVENIRKALKQYGYNSIRIAREHVGGIEDKSGRPKIPWAKEIMDEFMSLLKQNKNINEILNSINSNEKLVKKLKENNRNKLTKNLIYKMIKFFGYENLGHAKDHASTYNHRVVKVEYLSEKIDTGTITVDGNEELHNYHTFAICSSTQTLGVYTLNSNLGEIDDAVYFRNKLFTALNFPKNYFSMEDPNATRITLSAQDVKFARMIERLQSHFEEGLYYIATRHLKLVGFPEDSYDDLGIKMTPPSDWRELSRAEIVTNRINNANSLKGSQLLPDFDILTKWMKYTEDEAKEMMARLKVQKLEDLKLQILAQNPQLLGVGLPGSNEQEISSQPGGPSPMLGPQPPGGSTPTGPEMPPTGGLPPPMPPPPDDGMIPPAGQAKPLPDASLENAVKYDLEIQDYEREIDVESPDGNEIEGGF